MNRDIYKLVVVGILGVFLNACGAKQTKVVEELVDIDWLYEEIPFDMPRVQEPNIPPYQVVLTDFGAVGDGLKDNTKAFEKAINHVSEKGGGKIIIPKGIWLTGPIKMKSFIELNTEYGALVFFSSNFDLYPIIETSFEGLDTYRCISPIYGKGLTDIAITGEGVFDGNGDSWRPVKKTKLTEGQWKRKVKSGGLVDESGSTWYPSEKSRKGDTAGNFNVPDLNSLEEFEEVKDFLRPVLLSLISCNRVLLDGPTFQNSPAWNLHPLMCENVILRNLNIRNPWYSQNGDGLDLESCKNVLIYNNSFDVGDDAICFKSGKNEDGLKRNVPIENVIVKNNIVYHGHGGFVVGSEMSGGVKNVVVSNCTFIGTDCGLRFKSTRGRGGVVEDIYISDIDMVDIGAEAIRFNLFYGGESPVADDGSVGKGIIKKDMVEVTRTTPSFKNIYMKNIRSKGSGAAAYFQGLPEMKLQNINLENVKLEAKRGVVVIDANDFDWSGVEVIVSKGSALSLFNVNGFEGDMLNMDSPIAEVVQVNGDETKDIVLSGLNVDADKVVVGEQVVKGNVVVK
ncbi:MAG: glycoside hydrolase family 28 protein [Reichenbachiella sp.]